MLGIAGSSSRNWEGTDARLHCSKHSGRAKRVSQTRVRVRIPPPAPRAFEGIGALGAGGPRFLEEENLKRGRQARVVASWLVRPVGSSPSFGRRMDAAAISPLFACWQTTTCCTPYLYSASWAVDVLRTGYMQRPSVMTLGQTGLICSTWLRQTRSAQAIPPTGLPVCPWRSSRHGWAGGRRAHAPSTSEKRGIGLMDSCYADNTSIIVRLANGRGRGDLSSEASSGQRLGVASTSRGP